MTKSSHLNCKLYIECCELPNTNAHKCLSGPSPKFSPPRPNPNPKPREIKKPKFKLGLGVTQKNSFQFQVAILGQ